MDEWTLELAVETISNEYEIVKTLLLAIFINFDSSL